MTTTTARRSLGLDGAIHLAEGEELICGTKARTTRVNHVCSLEKIVTCSRCRKQVGWHTAKGSLRSRSTLGLDSSAWGANKGR